MAVGRRGSASHCGVATRAPVVLFGRRGDGLSGGGARVALAPHEGKHAERREGGGELQEQTGGLISVRKALPFLSLLRNHGFAQQIFVQFRL